MNLDFLISKYLDADLSAEEDKLLRKILSEDPSARETFDSSVAINHAMREDALNITLPAELSRQTEDKILMQILNQSNDVKIYSDYNDPVKFLNMKLRRRVKSVVSAIFATAVWFGTVVNLNDGSFRLAESAKNFLSDTGVVENVNGAASEGNFSSTVLEKKNSIVKKFFTGKNYSGQNIIPPASDDVIASAEENFSENIIQAEEKNSFEEKILSDQNVAFAEAPAVSTEINSDIEVSAPQIVSSLQTLPVRNFAEISPGNSFAIGNGKDEVQMTTFVSNDIYSQKKSSNSLSSVSQSISYGVSADDRIGIELGYSAYGDGNSNGNSDITYMLFRKGPGLALEEGQSVDYSSKGNIIAMGADPANPSKETPRSDSKASSTTALSPFHPELGNLYWGAAFYERRLMNLSPITVHARVGVGGSGEGGIGFGRLYGRYDLLSGLSVTLGAESRTLAIKLPEGIAKSYDVATSLSLIYGIQLRF